MSMHPQPHPQPIGLVPEDTARVARAAFPKGNLYMQMRDVLGTIYDDEDFSELFEVRGRPAITPWRLALVGSLLNMARQAQGLATPHGVKQRSQRGRRGQIRPRSPEAPEHDPRIQPTPHLSESHRP
jgi:hypothetical protein